VVLKARMAPIPNFFGGRILKKIGEGINAVSVKGNALNVIDIH
jgi:hypothetical protein